MVFCALCDELPMSIKKSISSLLMAPVVSAATGAEYLLGEKYLLVFLSAAASIIIIIII